MSLAMLFSTTYVVEWVVGNPVWIQSNVSEWEYETGTEGLEVLKK